MNTRAIEIGKANAEMALDQAADYSSVEAAIESFFDNVADSLVDVGLLTEENFEAATRSFNATITAKVSAQCNLPPGCSVADIERACGAGLPLLCGAQSPDGRFTCTIDLDSIAVETDETERHIGGHECCQDVVTYAQEPACLNPACPLGGDDGWPCNHEIPPTSWYDSGSFEGSGEYVIVARWPRREDDFDSNGAPTPRKVSAQ